MPRANPTPRLCISSTFSGFPLGWHFFCANPNRILDFTGSRAIPRDFVSLDRILGYCFCTAYFPRANPRKRPGLTSKSRCSRANPRDSQCLERILRLGFAFHVFLEQILLKQPAVLEQILEQVYSIAKVSRYDCLLAPYGIATHRLSFRQVRRRSIAKVSLPSCSPLPMDCNPPTFYSFL